MCGIQSPGAKIKTHSRNFLDTSRHPASDSSMPKRIAAVMLLGAAALLAAEDSLPLVPKRGPGPPPPNARGDGPWATRIMLATSTNGLDFQRLHFVVSDQAGVPSVVVDHDRRARVYYTDFGNGNILACAIQK